MDGDEAKVVYRVKNALVDRVTIRLLGLHILDTLSKTTDMKQFYLSFILVLVAAAAFSQGSIIMKINGITPANGEKLIAFESNATMTPPATKASFDNIKIKKPISLSSQLMKDLPKGAHIATAEFDFFDNTGTLIYKMNLTELSVTKFSYLSPECPTCQSLTNEVWLSFTSIMYTDPVNGGTFGWNLNTNAAL